MGKTACRLRKAECADCGYTIRVTRSWLEVGLPTCPCGGTIEPTEASDRAYCGLLTQDDVRAPVWTVICRENGWEDSIQRKGAAAKAFEARMRAQGGVLGRAPTKPQCEYPGCGKWTSQGLAHCSEHNPVRADLAPF